MLAPTLLFTTLFALSRVSAQQPPYLSPVVISPGLSNVKCVQPVGGSSASGTSVVLADCTGATAQEFFFENSQIRVFSNQCLTVPGGNNTNGVQLRLEPCNSNDSSQKFYYNFFNHNQISLLSTRSKCIDLTGGNTANGAALQIWSCSSGNPNQVWNVGYMENNLPVHSETDQVGYNNCGTGSSQSSDCQTLWINDVDDFCLWAPRSVGTIGDTERSEVAWCTKAGRGTRVIPAGTFHGVHFVKTEDYVQVTGVGDFTKINIAKGDAGGELDPHGADGNGNPEGGLVYGNTFASAMQYHEWTSFISDSLFCFRACIGENAAELCNHIYDQLGCYWNIPANYDAGVFESCDGEDDLPMGVYGTSTFHQGQSSTPSAHPAAPSSDCRRISTITPGTVGPTTTTTSPPTTTSPSSTGHVIHPKASSSKCLNAVSNAKGADVTIQDCNGSSNQQWTRVGNNFRVFGNLCLDVRDGVNADGTKMQVWSCGSGTNVNQQFTTDSAGQITWSGKDKCLDLTDGKTTNGQQMQIWQCSNGNNNQVWNIV